MVESSCELVGIEISNVYIYSFV